MEQAVHYAGFWRRLLAHLIDATLFTILVALPLLFLLVGDPLMEMGPGTDHAEKLSYGIEDLVIDIAFALLVIFFWVRFRGTPGKRLLSCEVVDAESGNNLSIGQATLRYFAYLLSLLPLGLGFLWVIWDPRKQGFHDKIARTVVRLGEPGWESGEEQKSIDKLVEESR